LRRRRSCGLGEFWWTRSATNSELGGCDWGRAAEAATAIVGWFGASGTPAAGMGWVLSLSPRYAIVAVPYFSRRVGRESNWASHNEIPGPSSAGGL